MPLFSANRSRVAPRSFPQARWHLPLRLSRLEPPVGVVGNSQTCMENKSRSIEGAGLEHLDPTETYVDRIDEVRALFGHVRAAVCSSTTARKLLELGAPQNLEIIEEDQTLERAA